MCLIRYAVLLLILLNSFYCLNVFSALLHCVCKWKRGNLHTVKIMFVSYQIKWRVDLSADVCLFIPPNKHNTDNTNYTGCHQINASQITMIACRLACFADLLSRSSSSPSLIAAPCSRIRRARVWEKQRVTSRSKLLHLKGINDVY